MANAIKSRNKRLPPAAVQRIVEKKIGKLFWSSEKANYGDVVPEESGEPFLLKSTGRGTLTAIPRSKKAQKRARSEATRRENMKIRPPQTPQERREAAKLKRERAARNRRDGRGTWAIDHKYPLFKLADDVWGLGRQLKKRTIDRIEAERGPVGDRPQNQELIRQTENELRRQTEMEGFKRKPKSVAKPTLTTSNGAVKFTVPLPKVKTKPKPKPKPRGGRVGGGTFDRTTVDQLGTQGGAVHYFDVPTPSGVVTLPVPTV